MMGQRVGICLKINCLFFIPYPLPDILKALFFRLSVPRIVLRSNQLPSSHLRNSDSINQRPYISTLALHQNHQAKILNPHAQASSVSISWGRTQGPVVLKSSLLGGTQPVRGGWASLGQMQKQLTDTCSGPVTCS